MIDLEVALLRATLVGTMLDEPQLCWLFGLAAMAPDGPAVECGVYKGGSLAVWAGAREGRGPIYAVDTWQAPKWHRARPEFDRLVAGLDIDVKVLVCNSWQATTLLNGQRAAFVFIDADHGESGIPCDVAAWPDAIMEGGILAMHDYDVTNPNIVVQRVVDEWHMIAKWHRLGIVGSTIAFMRPRALQIGGTR